MKKYLIFDLYQIFFSNLMMEIKGDVEDIEIDENLFRHKILNTIRSNKVKFSDYNDVIIAVDRNSWRKKVFPHYKGRRKKKDGWEQIFTVINNIINEINEYLPYRVIAVSGAEGDDVIGTLTHYLNQFGMEPCEIMIISADKDFRQLHTHRGVKQYDPINKKQIIESDPEGYLLDHILRGDSGDDVPNVLSDDDTHITAGKRQIALTQKKIQTLIVDGQPIEAIKVNFERNRTLIDLTQTPNDIQQKIIEQFNNQAGKKRDKIMNYFIQYQLKNLMQHIGEF